MKAHSPLLGFNNNVKHKGRVFHIQTEDSGARHPHIISHLFADGGRILKTTKTSYAEHVGADRMADIVRGLMKEQHKAMFIALRDGEFDPLFEGLVGANRSRPAAPPAPPAPPSSASSLVDGVPASPSAPAVQGKDQGAAAMAKTLPAPPGQPEAGKPGPQIHAPDTRGVSATALTSAALAQPGDMAAPAPPLDAELGGKADADLAAMERAADAPQSAVFQQIYDLPPPPAAVLGKKRPSDVPAGSYRTVSPQRPTSSIPAPAPRRHRARAEAGGNAGATRPRGQPRSSPTPAPPTAPASSART
ncbi:MAG: hypothetical protein WKG00_13135 [Polyangiaceae bacterium]